MRCDAPTLGDFLYRIALGGFHFGYFRYAVRTIPEGKDVGALDRKLMETYGVTSCRMKRLRNRQKGLASVQYVRFRSTFILMATEGEHAAFSRIRSFDIREAPLHIGGYSIGCVGDRISVRVAASVWKKVMRYHLACALQDSQAIEKKLEEIPFYRFPGVVAQIKDLTAAINQRRKPAGLPLISPPRRRRHQHFSRRSYQKSSAAAPSLSP